MAKVFQITSKSGGDFGLFRAADPAEALAGMHRDAGYLVHATGGRLTFQNPGDKAVCGDLSDWDVAEIDVTEYACSILAEAGMNEGAMDDPEVRAAEAAIMDGGQKDDAIAAARAARENA